MYSLQRNVNNVSSDKLELSEGNTNKHIQYTGIPRYTRSHFTRFRYNVI